MVTRISNSPEETEGIATAFARTLRIGSVVGLSGDLGSGKTQFVRGFARGLGVTERVHSPSFALINIYATGRVPLFHIDLYRLESDELIVSAGLTEYFEPQGITVIEWIDRWHGRLPSRFWRIEIETLGENERRISFHDRTGP
jgi:tRNA threonylcarbamoyladenosine biosynthesis protein TsaE